MDLTITLSCNHHIFLWIIHPSFYDLYPYKVTFTIDDNFRQTHYLSYQNIHDCVISMINPSHFEYLHVKQGDVGRFNYTYWDELSNKSLMVFLYEHEIKLRQYYVEWEIRSRLQ